VLEAAIPHAHLELGFEEHRTSELVASKLNLLNLASLAP
jgi:hypothetical protein